MVALSVAEWCSPPASSPLAPGVRLEPGLNAALNKTLVESPNSGMVITSQPDACVVTLR